MLQAPLHPRHKAKNSFSVKMGAGVLSYNASTGEAGGYDNSDGEGSVDHDDQTQSSTFLEKK